MREQINKFAKASMYAYMNKQDAPFSELGYTQIKFFDMDGAQCYAVSNDEEYALVFRGTEPSEISDVLADLNAIPRGAMTKGWVHSGFRNELDKVWDAIVQHHSEHKKKKFYICGHSLGAAMATIATSRFEETTKVDHLYTFGSPRVGTRKFVKNIETPHTRVVNNNDIVTTVPLFLMGYKHHGDLTYINYFGHIRKMSLWQILKDKWRGRWRAFKKGQPFDGAYDHGMAYYVKYTDPVYAEGITK